MNSYTVFCTEYTTYIKVFNCFPKTMKFRNSSLQQVIDCFTSDSLLQPINISLQLNKSPALIHRYLKELVKQGILVKDGLGAHVRYKLSDKQLKILKQEYISSDKEFEIFVEEENHLPYSQVKIMEESFFKFSASGEIQEGIEGFYAWCKDRKLNPQDKIGDYISIYKHIEKIRTSCGVIDATDAFDAISGDSYFNHIFYADQYKWMDFGRGKLAELTFYAKQSQKLSLINASIDMIIHKIRCLIGKYKINHIAIVPPSIQRKNQLLKLLKKKLEILNLPFLSIVKDFPNDIPIPQKSLKNREQRLENAKKTIIVKEEKIQKEDIILLIDDFVGSGSTLNQTAKKLKDKGAGKIIGFAFVGNTNLTYEVINEI